NRATNTFSFNTYVTNLLFVEAEDYNYSAGGFVDNLTNLGYSQYAGLLGTNGIDYLDHDLTGTNNAYRPGDLPQIQPATDLDHNGFIANGVPDYNLGYTETGEWQNYTRNLSNTTYSVF